MDRSDSYMHTTEYREKIRLANLKRYALHPMSEETKQKISKSNSGKIRRPEWNKHISEAKAGKPSPLKGRSMNKGIPKSPECRKHQSEGRKKYLREHPEIVAKQAKIINSKAHTKEANAKMAKGLKVHYANHPEACKAISERNKLLWQDSEYLARFQKAIYSSPNNQEKELEIILQNAYPNQFGFNGDFRLGITLDRMIPDFVNINGKKQVIELFGEYWHQLSNEGEDRIERYNKLGWKCLIIWGKELKDTIALATKIQAFVEGGVIDG
jgi:very-short-patch-repair endonuclease